MEKKRKPILFFGMSKFVCMSADSRNCGIINSQNTVDCCGLVWIIGVWTVIVMYLTIIYNYVTKISRGHVMPTPSGPCNWMNQRLGNAPLVINDETEAIGSEGIFQTR